METKKRFLREATQVFDVSFTIKAKDIDKARTTAKVQLHMLCEPKERVLNETINTRIDYRVDLVKEIGVEDMITNIYRIEGVLYKHTSFYAVQPETLVESKMNGDGK